MENHTSPRARLIRSFTQPEELNTAQAASLDEESNNKDDAWLDGVVESPSSSDDEDGQNGNGVTVQSESHGHRTFGHLGNALKHFSKLDGTRSIRFAGEAEDTDERPNFDFLMMPNDQLKRLVFRGDSPPPDSARLGTPPRSGTHLTGSLNDWDQDSATERPDRLVTWADNSPSFANAADLHDPATDLPFMWTSRKHQSVLVPDASARTKATIQNTFNELGNLIQREPTPVTAIIPTSPVRDVLAEEAAAARVPGLRRRRGVGGLDGQLLGPFRALLGRLQEVRPQREVNVARRLLHVQHAACDLRPLRRFDVAHVLQVDEADDVRVAVEVAHHPVVLHGVDSARDDAPGREDRPVDLLLGLVLLVPLLEGVGRLVVLQQRCEPTAVATLHVVFESEHAEVDLALLLHD